MLRNVKLVIAGAVAVCVLVAPARAAARTTVSVQIAYGGFVAGGIGAFLYLAGSWEMPLAPRDLRTSLIEVGGGRTRIGVPLPTVRPRSDPEDPRADGLQFEVIRWRF